MKNLLRKYQVPTTGWDYWYLKDEGEWSYDYEEVEYVERNPFNRYFDNEINNLPTRTTSSYYRDIDRKYMRGYDEHLRRAQSIMEHSEGMHISVVRQKVIAALKYTRAYRGRELEFMERSLDTYEMDNGKRYFKNLDGKYTYLGRNSWIRGFLVENMDGIIELYRGDSPKKSSRDDRGRYQAITWRRKENKESNKDRKRLGNFYLKLINKPELFDFFKKIEKEYKALNEIEKKSHRAQPDRNGKNYWWNMYMWRRDVQAFDTGKRRRRDKIRQDLDDMLQGDFTSYYTSKEYLYTIYKECHHFSSP